MNNIASTKESHLIQQIQNNWINEENNYPLERNQFRISSAPNCSQKTFYNKLFQLLELEDSDMLKILPFNTFEPDLVAEGIFACGNVFHFFIQKHILPKISGYLLGTEIPVKIPFKNIELIGHTDLKIQDPLHGIKICDIKTRKPSAFNFITNKANPHDIRQVNLYAYAFKINYFTILYVNKIDFSMVEHSFQLNEDLALSELLRLHSIYKKAEETLTNLQNKLPIEKLELEADNEDYECHYITKNQQHEAYCPFYNICNKKTKE